MKEKMEEEEEEEEGETFPLRDNGNEMWTTDNSHCPACS
jgi:hypothetical protein